MKVLKIEQLQKEKFSIDEISAIHQSPSYKNLNIISREHNGFLLIESGECVYQWENNKEILNKGDCIYLPFGSVHKLFVTSDEQIKFIRLNFVIFDENKEKIIFSKLPFIVSRRKDEVINEKIKKMTDLFMNIEGNFLKRAALYEIFHRMVELNKQVEKDSITRVIEHINRNYTKEINIRELTDICFMSQAQMYREFKKRTAVSPIKYRNNLRIEQAKILLKNDTITVIEICYMLGFDNIGYFSRLFKEKTGMSPSTFRKSDLII